MQSTRAHRDVKSLSSGDVLTDDVTGDRYRVLSLVGQGGMGRVFKVQQARTGDIFAVKCNQPIDPTNRTLVERVRREGEFLKGLRPHPHIVPVLATGVTEDGVCWMLMPLLDGASVGTLLSVLPRIALVWALEISRAVCSALSAVHQAAIHRDIKPDNVFVTRQGGIYVLDWGAGKFYAVGRLTTTGTTLGTIAYSSPEQLRDPDALDGRSDLFSVGILLFQMLSGHHPFAREGQANEDPITLGYRIIHERPRALAALAPELPGYVAKVTHKLLEKDRADRNRNAAEAAQVFVAALNELRSRLGAPLPIARLFDAYDATLAAQESERLATQDTERSAAAKEPSGPRAKLGTVPLAAFAAPAHPPELPAPLGTTPAADPASSPSALPASATPATSAPVGGGTVPMHSAAFGEDFDTYIRRKLLAIDRLRGDDTPETRTALLFVLGEHEESPILRAGAARALEGVGDEASLEALQDVASTDPHPLVRRAAEAAALALSVRLGLRVEPLPFLPLSEPLARPPQPTQHVARAAPPPAAAPIVHPAPPAEPRPLEAPLSARPGTRASVEPPPVAHGPRPWSTRSLTILALLSALISFAVVGTLLYLMVGRK